MNKKKCNKALNKYDTGGIISGVTGAIGSIASAFGPVGKGVGAAISGLGSLAGLLFSYDQSAVDAIKDLLYLQKINTNNAITSTNSLDALKLVYSLLGNNTSEYKLSDFGGVWSNKAKLAAELLNALALELNLLKKDLYLNQMQNIITNLNNQTNLLAMANLAADGGLISIKPSKKGTFTAAASKHNMGVQEFANKVLSNKENYSPTMVKKANFAHIFGGRHYADGGYLIGKVYDVSPQEVQRLKSLGYGIEEV